MREMRWMHWMPWMLSMGPTARRIRLALLAASLLAGGLFFVYGIHYVTKGEGSFLEEMSVLFFYLPVIIFVHL